MSVRQSAAARTKLKYLSLLHILESPPACQAPVFSNSAHHSCHQRWYPVQHRLHVAEYGVCKAAFFSGVRAERKMEMPTDVVYDDIAWRCEENGGMRSPGNWMRPIFHSGCFVIIAGSHINNTDACSSLDLCRQTRLEKKSGPPAATLVYLLLASPATPTNTSCLQHEDDDTAAAMSS